MGRWPVGHWSEGWWKAANPRSTAARGAAIATSIASLRDRARIIRRHHEHCDGTGYLDGLKGEAIPLESRIISVVDTFLRVLERHPDLPHKREEEVPLHGSPGQTPASPKVAENPQNLV